MSNSIQPSIGQRAHSPRLLTPLKEADMDPIIEEFVHQQNLRRFQTLLAETQRRAAPTSAFEPIGRGRGEGSPPLRPGLRSRFSVPATRPRCGGRSRTTASLRPWSRSPEALPGRNSSLGRLGSASTTRPATARRRRRVAECHKKIGMPKIETKSTTRTTTAMIEAIRT